MNQTMTCVEEELLLSYPYLKTAQSKVSHYCYQTSLNMALAIDSMLKASSNSSFPKHQPLNCLDVGVKNWSYLSGLVSTLHQHTESFQLTGIEIQPYWKNQDGSLCGTQAQHQANLHKNTLLIEGNVLDLKDSYDLICVFSPYLFPESHQAGGLSLELFNTQLFFDHIINHLLKPNGLLLITNQGTLEFQTQADLLATYLTLSKHFSGELAQPFTSLPYTRYGWLLEKTN